MESEEKFVRKVHYVPNGQGWLLAVKQTYSPARLSRNRRPAAIVPGYGMNAFIFGYHPTGSSMEAYWAGRGFEVWSVNLRGQDGSRCAGGKRSYGFHDAAVTDLGCVLDHILRHTETGCERVDGVGCSLGGTYLYVHLACRRTASRLGSVVAIGAPLQLRQMHPVLKAVFGSPRLAGSLRIRGVRPLARMVMPLLKHMPWLLHLYLHPAIVDTSKMNEMIQTVENPNAVLNRQIAEWMRTGDLWVRGVNVTEGVAEARNPLLVVLSNADGIVPEASALSAYERMGSSRKEILRVGTEAVPVAHADLFVSDISQQWVFEPLAEWLIEANRETNRRDTGSRPAAAGEGRARKRRRARKVTPCTSPPGDPRTA